MAYQILQGVTISPKGSYNLSRFSNDFQGSSWPTSFAFGGWIYNASVDVGFSNQATEIKINIVLEAADRRQIKALFDISPKDLRCDAGDGGDENLYDIDLSGIQFTNFILYSYDISIEGGSKILNVSFKDYSIILDKIYIGLMKRQGNKTEHVATSVIQFPVNCEDCLLNGSSFTQVGLALRDISYGSYVGINGGTYDNFENLNLSGNIYNQWKELFNAQPATIKFDLNGGYLIIGTEDASEEKCGDLSNISYNFNQLLASLRLRGLAFNGAFPFAQNDSDFIYKQNYIGTLREVLQQWCSDLGYDFYCSGKTFIGINTTVPIDISKIQDVVDPTTELGRNFALNQNSAVLSYKENNTIAGTHRQTVITANTRARQTKTHSKSPKRYVGLTPLHPIDFNAPSKTIVNRFDLFGNHFFDEARINNFTPGSEDTNKTLSQLDNRTFGDIDTAIALSHFDADLRDIYCQDRAIYGETEEIRAAHFKALGFVPLIEIENANDKAFAIQSVNSSNGDEIQNICLDSRFYKVFIGYSYSKFKEDITTWEQDAASVMYKFAALTKGISSAFPFMPPDIYQDISPYAGLYGTFGTQTTRIKHTFEPDSKQFYDLYDAPYKDIVLYSGLRNGADFFPANTYLSEINNDWGTTPENFKRDLSLKLDDACVQEFSQSPSYTNIAYDVDHRFQDWRLSLFKPQAISDLTNFYSQYGSAFAKISGDMVSDREIKKYYDFNYSQGNTCAKLHIIVLCDTRAHPNIDVDFTKYGTNFVNKVVLQKYLKNEKDAIARRLQTKTPSTCDISLLQEMCDSTIAQQNLFNLGKDPRFACSETDQNNAFEEGFDASYLSAPNSRGLDIKIVKNPVRNNDSDKIKYLLGSSDQNGNFYYGDLIANSINADQKQVNLTIVYPISVLPTDDIHYKGILTSNIEVENRSPEIVEIFGEPPNEKRNASATIKVINNTVDPDIQPQLDPYSNRYLSYYTVVTGDAQIITSVSGYHDFIKKLNNYEITGFTKSIELSLAGTPSFFGTFSQYLKPAYGMNKMSISVTDNGVVTSLSYADRPEETPKQESILNKIGPRIGGRLRAT